MSSGMFLVLNVEGGVEFDTEVVRNCLKRLEGAYNWREESDRFVFRCEFKFRDNSTIVTMVNERDVISIEGKGDASLQVALEIQKCYPADVHALDSECPEDVPLSEVSDLEELRQRIHRRMPPSG